MGVGLDRLRLHAVDRRRYQPIGSSVGTAVLNTVAVSATRDDVGTPTAALVHGFATATDGAALVAGAVLAVAFLRPAAHDHVRGGTA